MNVVAETKEKSMDGGWQWSKEWEQEGWGIREHIGEIRYLIGDQCFLWCESMIAGIGQRRTQDAPTVKESRVRRWVRVSLSSLCLAMTIACVVVAAALFRAYYAFSRGTRLSEHVVRCAGLLERLEAAAHRL